MTNQPGGQAGSEYFFSKKNDAHVFTLFWWAENEKDGQGVEKVYDAWKLFTFMATASICRDEICDLVESHSLQTVNLIYGTLGGPTWWSKYKYFWAKGQTDTWISN